MYLHGFSTPDIEEYDTLSSEDKWNEYYDVILANPPFFSPTGGIQPHKRFGVDSNKAEVLFTSYILEHLKPNGRAGIIIPEGIIFQSTTKAYIELRKQLIDNGLIGVISLPAGVFNPYSPVKTSILILDKKESKERDSIFFAEVKNDGFSLGAQRNEIEENDLPKLLDDISSETEGLLNFVTKEKITTNPSYALSLNTYIDKQVRITDFPLVKIGEVFKTSSGGTPKAGKKEYYKDGNIPWVRSGEVDGNYITNTEIKITQAGLNESSAKLFPTNSVLVAMYGATAGKVGMLGIEASTNQAVCAIFPNERCITKYLYYILRSQEQALVDLSVGGGQPNISQTIIKNYEIPLPPLEVQQEIVDELEGYQKIIDGCKQVVENYKPTIDIDPSWEIVELGEVCEMIKRGITPKYAEKDGLIVINQKCIREHSINLEESRLHNNNEKKVAEEKFVKYGDVLVNSTGVGTLGRVAQYIDQNDIDLTVDSHVTIVRPKKGYFEDNFFGYVMIMIENQIMKSGKGSTGQTELSRVDLSEMRISFPKDKLEQKEIVQKLEEERTVIEGNKKLIENYTQKIQNRINKVWGEE